MKEIIYIVMYNNCDCLRIDKVFKNKKSAEDYILDKCIELYEGSPEKWNKIIEEGGKYAQSNKDGLVEEFKLGLTRYEIEEHFIF
jgi:hypothetical protein